MRKYVAELVIFDLADVGSRASQVCKPGDRIGHGSARHLGRGAHQVVDLVSAFLVNERHRPRRRAYLVEKSVVDMRENIDDCVADAQQLYGLAHLFRTSE